MRIAIIFLFWVGLLIATMGALGQYSPAIWGGGVMMACGGIAFWIIDKE